MKLGKNKNWFRIALQSLIVAILAYMVVRIFVDKNYLADFEAYCPFGGMQALASFFVTNSLACSMTESQIFMGVVLLVGVVFASKLFCSYLCPIGTFTEWLGKLGERMHMRYTITGLADRLLRSLKYILLFLTFYFTVSTSELFCKEYDPFYAVFTWFGHDVNLVFAVVAIIITVLGAIFIRQFWCKYLCPLGAAANTFIYAENALALAAIYFLLRIAGVQLGWIWLIGSIIFTTMIFEMARLKGWWLPAFKITRDDHKCTHCLECNLACPMAIDISESTEIRHIDCHLCGDCLSSCPEKEVLQINKKEIRWLPSAVTVVLVAIGIGLAATIELPTINLRWGSESLLKNAMVYEQSGLKSVKCFGSATSFATRMKRVPGVLGVEAFVKTHTVKLLYDPNQTDNNQIRKSIFTPATTLLRKSKLNQLQKIDVSIDKLFDSYDNFYLTRLLAQNKGIFGFASHYGEPVQASIYFDIKTTSPENIVRLINSPELTYKLRDKSYTVGLEFSAVLLSDSVETIDNAEFISRMFKPYSLQFNGYKDIDSSGISIYRIPMPQALNPRFRRQYQYLAAHLSMDSAIVKFETIYHKTPYAQIYFRKNQIPPADIYTALKKDTLEFMYSSGKIGRLKNPFKFSVEGNIIKE